MAGGSERMRVRSDDAMRSHAGAGRAREKRWSGVRPAFPALVRLDPALAFEQLQRLVHGRPVHFERPREVARRRQALSLEVPAAADVADDGVRNRPVERHACGLGGVERVPRHARACCPWPRPRSNGPRQRPTKSNGFRPRSLAAGEQRGIGALHLLGEEQIPLARALDDAPRPRQELLLRLA